MVGLILQASSVLMFCVRLVGYLGKYHNAVQLNIVRPLVRRERFFFGSLGSAGLSLLVRCSYRCYELHEGYRLSELVTNELLFIGLEGV